MIERCRFRDNVANSGGGAIAALFLANITIEGSEFTRNRSQSGGGAINAALAFGTVFVFNSLIAENRGRSGAGGMSGTGIGLLNCTVVRNSSDGTQPGGLNLSVSSAVVNCIVRGNTSAAPSRLEQQVSLLAGGPKPAVLFSNVAGISGVPTNFDADPWFVDPARGDYHILPGSSCQDAGATLGLSSTQTDIDGQPRVQGAEIDVGADELQPET